MKITLYSKEDCGYCTMAEALCKNNGYDYAYLKMGYNFERELIVEKFPQARSFPVVTIDGVYLGGFEELKKWHEEQKGQ